MNEFRFLGTRCVGVYETASGTNFVCNAEAQKGEQIYFECGEGDTLGVARENAYIKLKQRLEKDLTSCLGSTGSIGCKNDLKGGGNKPSSSAQQELLRNLALNLGISLGNFIYEKFQKNIPDLLGFEADQAIKSLKAKIESRNN